MRELLRYSGRVVPVLLALLVLLLGLAPAARAQEAPEEPGTELQVFLLTMGQGDAVWERFGHSAIWIRDAGRGTDRVYNYGLFDFHAPGYWKRFLKGNWIYQIGVSDISQTMLEYQYLNRTMVAQALNLTPAERLELRDFLEWQALPENREYRYDYYRDNCSTRIRDVLDRVVGGRLAAATQGVSTETTFRWHTERLIADDKLSYIGLLIGLGPAADRPIDAWQEMFLPEYVHDQIARLSVPAADGQHVPLVASEHVLVEAAGREPERTTPPFWLPYFLAAGIAVGAVLAGLAAWGQRARTGRILFALLGALWSLLAGLSGVLLLALWTLTDHTIAHRNENLFQLEPLSLALVVLVPALAFGARWAPQAARRLTLAVLALSVLGLVLKVFPWFYQVNGSLIAFTLPVHLGLAAGVWVLAGKESGIRGQGSGESSVTSRRSPVRTGNR
jgi:hypothetical protein